LVKLCSIHGVFVLRYDLIVGLPGESVESFAAGFEAAARATEAQWREYYQMSKRP
jgi:tRNA A37 methylthiotransferase MiaB